MDERSILGRISDLIEEEHNLRTGVQAGQISTDEEHDRLRDVEQQLDQCWDLLRRRRAAGAAGDDPDAVEARSTEQVEGYLQ